MATKVAKVVGNAVKQVKQYPLLDGAKLVMHKTFTQAELETFGKAVGDVSLLRKSRTDKVAKVPQNLTDALFTSFASVDLPSGVALVSKNATYLSSCVVGERIEVTMELNKRENRKCYFTSHVSSLDDPSKLICTIKSTGILPKHF